MNDDDELPLFSYALARRSDPDTSHEAADAITFKLPELEAMVLSALRQAGPNGRTLDELMDCTGLEKVTVSPRLRPLCDKGLVIDTEMRRPGRSGRKQIVWVALPKTESGNGAG